jgi:hypothetical protein
MKTQVKVKQTLLRNRQVLSVSGGWDSQVYDRRHMKW